MEKPGATEDQILSRIKPGMRAFPNQKFLCSGWQYRIQSDHGVGFGEGQLSLGVFLSFSNLYEKY
ncbi:hypothetical protein K443DRAFT_685759 [Laccaria amethystina LaAM-08-1]|uniref:Uncharacterized protein n=1 Tax=Laccaria amethystina LaAM-08-1 TaxID=1095629 RepID=A0A0C9WTR4_9AGAR|nr:hypothetical protein K443DRAFT_685759 [Laccaria amethystina LaAM-08-1]